MKIYDDRFMDMASPYDEDEIQLYDQSTSTHVWFQFALTEEWDIRGELTAYEKHKDH